MLFSRSHTSIGRNRRNRLQVETLECRHLLSASGCGLYGPHLPSQSTSEFCGQVSLGLDSRNDGGQSFVSVQSSNFSSAPFDVELVRWHGRRTPVVVGEWIVKLSTAQTAPHSNSDDVTFVRRLSVDEESDLWLVKTEPGLLPYQVARAVGESQVSFVEPNFAVAGSAVPNDPQFDQLWGIENTGQTGGTAGADVGAVAAWEMSTGAHDVVIAAFDSGIDYEHPDLAENIWNNLGEVPGNGIDDDGNGFVDDFFGVDVFSRSVLPGDVSPVDEDFGGTDPMDFDGHGTHTAGTLGAVGDNGIGVAGVAWDVQIMPIKFLSDSGFGSNDKAILGMNYMLMMKRDFGINIVASNHSWSGASYSQVLDGLISDGIELGITFVASAGNDSMNNDAFPTYPAAYSHDGVITVAATDANDDLAEFSRFGSQTVDLAAPGVDILSTVLGGDYGLNSGTSMSAPFVTGAVALLKSQFPGASPSQIKSAILNGVDPLPSLAGKTVSGGRLNIAGAFEEMGFFVNSSTPEHFVTGETVQSKLTAFDLTLSHEMNAQSVSAADFEINGMAADTVAVLDDTLRFEYVVSPVSEQGLQAMTLAAGSVSRATDGLPNELFTATFRYDAEPLELAGAIPSIVSLPWSTLDVSFTEPVDATSFDLSDVWVSDGDLLDMEVLSSQTVRFRFAEIVNEVEQFQFRLYKGAINDSFGSPLPDHIDVEFELDHTLSDFPGDWIPLEPQSSLAAERIVRGRIARVGDRDEFRVHLTEGQLMSVAITGAHVSLSAPGGELIAPFEVETTSGRRWGTHLAETTGYYQIGVSGENAIGDYELTTMVNAVFEDGISHQAPSVLLNDYEVATGSSHQAVVVGQTNQARTYEIDLAENETLSVYVESEMVNGVDIVLRSEAGDELHSIFNGRHAKTIERFSGPAGRYRIVVQSHTDDYRLVTTRNGLLDNQRNYVPSIAQEVPLDTIVNGFLQPGSSPAIDEVRFDEIFALENAHSSDVPFFAFSAANQDQRAARDLSPGDYIIALDPQIELDHAATILSAKGIRVTRELTLFHAVAVSVESEVRIAGDDWISQWITHVEIDGAVKGQGQISNDPLVADQWALESTNSNGDMFGYGIDLREAWAQQPNAYVSDSKPVVVAILDTGIDLSHPDLAGSLWRNPSEIAGNGIDDDENGTVDDDIGYDILNESGLPMDDNGHGTHLAGIVGAVLDNELGVTGVAPGVELLPIKVLDENQNGNVSDVLAGLQYLLQTSAVHQLDLGAVLLSWTTETQSQFLEDSIEAVNAALNTVVVVPAGNDGQDRAEHPVYPASADLSGMISVAGVDQTGQLADFSGYGESISMAGPGVDVLSTLPGGEYGYLSGTSAASAFVAGAAALLTAANPGATAAEISEALRVGAQGDIEFQPLVGANRLSGGRLNIADSLQSLNSSGDYYRVTVSEGVPLRLTAKRGNSELSVFESQLVIGLEVLSENGEVIATADVDTTAGSAELLFEPAESGNVLVHVSSLEGYGRYEMTLRTVAHPDFDGDRQLGCADLSLLQEQFNVASPDLRFDLTGDGDLDNEDVLEWITVHLGSVPGDANLDGVVDGSDWNIWNDHKFTSGRSWCEGDFTVDGSVDVSDWNVWFDRRFTGDPIVAAAWEPVAREPRQPG